MTTQLDIAKIRADFPILHQTIHGKPLIYLDNAATSQKPKPVIEALTQYYQEFNANIHRGIHHLAEKATTAYEQTREAVRAFLNAPSVEQIIFTRGVTEAMNLIAQTYGRQNIQKGDEIIISTLEHHSNIVPWQILCEEKGATLKVIPINEKGELIIEEYQKLLSPRTKIVSVLHVSNALGTINPIEQIIDLAHQAGAVTVIDGAQAASHLEIDVQALNCDFYAFSGHKVYAPTGIGALYGKKHLLESMPPYHGGGEMIKEVTFEKTTYNELPYKFEAGTPNIADTIALKSALDYVRTIGKNTIAQHEDNLLAYATQTLQSIKGLRIVGQAEKKISVVSFILDGIHHQDVGILLDNEGIAVRTGHHCTQPLMKHLGLLGTIRASFAMYNTTQEIERLAEGIEKAIRMLR
ncbi:MAG: cysteine desulfurase [Microscillaceae bacterium]|nr:cysteine desulfurase [Microscillaceae bacterium]MDW8460400.1 cysteine desulfurase [Cytophagales bacterium]